LIYSPIAKYGATLIIVSVNILYGSFNRYYVGKLVLFNPSSHIGAVHFSLSICSAFNQF